VHGSNDAHRFAAILHDAKLTLRQLAPEDDGLVRVLSIGMPGPTCISVAFS
jgi:hypothetical protein